MILVTGATGLNGSAVIAAWFRSTGAACAGARLVPLAVNGGAGFAQYGRDSDGTAHQAFAIHVIQSSGDRITALHTFLAPRSSRCSGCGRRRAEPATGNLRWCAT